VEWANTLVVTSKAKQAQDDNFERLSDSDPAQPPSMEGVCNGVSGKVLFFGEISQRTVATTAQQENKILKSLLVDRIEMLVATRYALDARNKTLNELISAKAACFHCQAAVDRAKIANTKDPARAQADLVAAQKAHYLAQAVVVRLEKRLQEATVRVKREWLRINDEWVALFKAGLLEAAYANHRLHQMHNASLNTLLASIQEEQRVEREQDEMEERQELEGMLTVKEREPDTAVTSKLDVKPDAPSMQPSFTSNSELDPPICSGGEELDETDVPVDLEEVAI